MLVADGSIFQTTSDTEVLLHLYARSKAPTVEQALIESRVAGAGRVFARAAHQGSADRRARSARVPAADARPAGRRLHRLLGDVRARSDRRRVDPRHRARRGVHRRPGGRDSRIIRFRRRRRRTASSSTSILRGLTRTCSAAASTKSAPSSAAGSPTSSRRAPMSSCPFPTRACARRLDSPRPSGLPLQMGLIRNHYVGRTFIEPHQSIRHFGVRVKLNPVKSILQGTPGRARRRLDRARHDEPEDREDGARGGRQRSAHAHQLSADDLAVLLRRRYAAARRS